MSKSASGDPRVRQNATFVLLGLGAVAAVCGVAVLVLRASLPGSRAVQTRPPIVDTVDGSVPRSTPEMSAIVPRSPTSFPVTPGPTTDALATPTAKGSGFPREVRSPALQTEIAAMPSSGSCPDEVGDVADADGSLPEVKMPGADVTGVEIRVDAQEVRVVFTASEAIPVDAGPSELGGDASVLWYVLTNSDGAGAYLLQAELVGSHWYADAFDLDEAQRPSGADRARQRSQLFEKPVVAGKSVTVRFPLRNLPRFAVPLTWSAGTEWGDFDIYGDLCPDKGRMRFVDTDSFHSGPNPS